MRTAGSSSANTASTQARPQSTPSSRVITRAVACDSWGDERGSDIAAAHILRQGSAHIALHHSGVGGDYGGLCLTHRAGIYRETRAAIVAASRRPLLIPVAAALRVSSLGAHSRLDCTPGNVVPGTGRNKRRHALHTGRWLVAAGAQGALAELRAAADVPVMPELLVIHNISLPPRCYGGDCIERFFTNRLDWDEHPYFEEIRGVEVSAHLLIQRTGELLQFVNFGERAWHAGQSCYQGRDNCNDFSIGIELEGSDDDPYTDAQYAALAAVTALLMSALSRPLARIESSATAISRRGAKPIRDRPLTGRVIDGYCAKETVHEFPGAHYHPVIAPDSGRE